jgi:AcrR family transcriptional regulator
LTIGAQLLAERHLDEVQITEIADRAGVSRGLLYHYFPTKQDFAIAVARSACAEVFAAEPDPALPVDERARRVLDAYVEFAEANQDAYRAMHISLVADPRVRELRAADLAGHEQRVLGAFGIAEPSPILRAAIRGWLAFVIAVILDWLADRGGMSREDVVELCTRTLVDVVGRYVSADG